MSDVVTFLSACAPGFILGWISADAWGHQKYLAGTVTYLFAVLVTFVCLAAWAAR